MEDNEQPELTLDTTINLFLEEKYASCIGSLEYYADQQNANACSKFGLAFQLGLGVPINFDKAIYYLSKAIDLGSGEAAHNLATLYATMPEKDVEKSKSWFAKAKELGFDPSIEKIRK